jgi:Mn-dependent DtxR family transcriptional regulator
MTKPLTIPHEDYLERICELLDEKGYARVTDMAQRLNVAPPSVTMMLKKLELSGHIVRERYRGFTLTAKGKTVGRGIRKRHEILSEFLHILKLPEHIIEHDIEGLEHGVSNQTLVKLEQLIRKLKH